MSCVLLGDMCAPPLRARDAIAGGRGKFTRDLGNLPLGPRLIFPSFFPLFFIFLPLQFLSVSRSTSFKPVFIKRNRETKWKRKSRDLEAKFQPLSKPRPSQKTYQMPFNRPPTNYPNPVFATVRLMSPPRCPRSEIQSAKPYNSSTTLFFFQIMGLFL